jgi:hypothetical protein
MRARLSSLLVLLAAGRFVVACGGGGGGGSPTDGGSTATNETGADVAADVEMPGMVTLPVACQQYAAAYCKQLQSCFAFALTSVYGTESNCETRLAIACNAAGTAPSTANTPAAIASCATAAAAASCSAEYQDQVPAACSGARGSLATGAACLDGAQCKSGFCPKVGACGTCAVAPSAGGACVNGACPAGLKCNGSAVCATPATAGATCKASADCESDLVCASGKCTTPAKSDAACSFDGSTAPECDSIAGLFCNTSTKRCEPFKSATTGAACGLDTTTGSFTLCDSASYCQTVDATKATGKCVARVADGAACTADGLLASNPCSAPAVCDGGTCKLPNGAACK